MAGLRKKGFVLMLVIIAMSLVGVIMLVLTSGANTMLFQSDTAYLRAIERNLTASGLAWAKQNIHNGTETFNRTIILDIADMNVRNATLTLTVSTPVDDRVEVQIVTSCTRGRQTRQNADKYQIKLQ